MKAPGPWGPWPPFHHHGTVRVAGRAIDCADCMRLPHLADVVDKEDHSDAWEIAKRQLRIVDVREMSPQKFSECLLLAEQIRRRKQA